MNIQKLEDLRQRADAARNNGRTAEAINLYNMLHTNAVVNRVFAQAGNALHMIGVCHKMQNNLSLALDWLNRAIEFYRDYHLHGEAANVQRDLGMAYEYAGRYHEARKPLEESMAMLRHSNDQPGYGITLAKLGLVCMRLGDYTEAEQRLNESIKLLSALVSVESSTDVPWFFHITAVWHRAQLRVEQELWEDALQDLTGARLLLERHGKDDYSWRYAQFQGLAAYCFARRGELSRAREPFETAMGVITGPTMDHGSTQHLLREIKAEETERLLAA